MNLFWKWDQAISKDVCEIIQSKFNQQSSKIAQLDGGRIDPNRRNSDIYWLKPNDWVEGILYNHVRYANKSAGWNFDIENIEPVQLTKYEVGGFYDWHTDDDMISTANHHRKLSVVMLLSDSSEYEGGGLYLKKYPENLLQNQGDIVVFPSFLEHKAAEVTSGVRMTAVGWVSGPPFK